MPADSLPVGAPLAGALLSCGNHLHGFNSSSCNPASHNSTRSTHTAHFPFTRRYRYSSSYPLHPSQQPFMAPKVDEVKSIPQSSFFVSLLFGRLKERHNVLSIYPQSDTKLHLFMPATTKGYCDCCVKLLLSSSRDMH